MTGTPGSGGGERQGCTRADRACDEDPPAQKTGPRRSQPCEHLALGLLASRAMRKEICCLSHPICALCQEEQANQPRGGCDGLLTDALFRRAHTPPSSSGFLVLFNNSIRYHGWCLNPTGELICGVSQGPKDPKLLMG